MRLYGDRGKKLTQTNSLMKCNQFLLSLNHGFSTTVILHGGVTAETHCVKLFYVSSFRWGHTAAARPPKTTNANPNNKQTARA